MSRILQQPEKIPDPNCSDYHPINDASQEVKHGVVEITIDDVRRVLSLRQKWVESNEETLVDSMIAWETEECRYRRVQLGGVEDEASCTVTVSGIFDYNHYYYYHC